MEMSLWQFFLARRAFKKSAETWQKLWRKISLLTISESVYQIGTGQTA